MKEIKLYYKLRFTYTANAFFYWLTTIPLVKHIIPRNVYSYQAIKIVFNTVITLIRIPFRLIGECFTLLSFSFILCIPLLVNMFMTYGDNVSFQLFSFIFSPMLPGILLIGLLVASAVPSGAFSSDRKKTYAVRSLLWDPKSYMSIEALEKLMSMTIALVISLLVITAVFDIPFFVSVFLFFWYIVCYLSCQVIIFLRFRSAKRSVHLQSSLVITFIMATSLVLVYKHVWFSLTPLFCTVFLVIGTIGAMGAMKYWMGLSSEEVLGLRIRFLDDKKEIALKQSQVALRKRTQIKDTDFTVDDAIKQKKGFKFFNSMFVARHRSLLIRPVEKFSFWSGVVVLVLCVVLLFYRDSQEIVRFGLFDFFPFILMALYFINRGESFCNALFFNCDHSMLVYRFYRERQNVLTNFWLRYRTLISLNALPTLIIAAGLLAFSLISDMNIFDVRFIVLILSVLATNFFFSFHHLFMYTLFQPYDANLEMKSKTFSIINGIFYIAIFQLQNIPVDFVIYGLFGVTILYHIIGTLLVYKFAPSRYRLRS